MSLSIPVLCVAMVMHESRCIFLSDQGWLMACFNLVKIQQQFSLLLANILTMLVWRVTAVQVHQFLLTIFPTNDKNPGHIPNSFHDIFSADIWTHDSTVLLEHVTKHFLHGISIAEDLIQRYNNDLQSFHAATKIVDCYNEKCRSSAKKVLGEKEVFCKYQDQNHWPKLNVEVDVKERIIELRMSYVDDLLRTLLKQFDETDNCCSVLTVEDVTPTKLQLSWLVPARLVDELLCLTPKVRNFLENQNITLVAVKNYKIFDKDLVSTG